MCEMALGLWLWANWYPRQTRWVALAWFSALLAASVTMAVAGRKSCTCFGPIEAVPWAMAALDLAAIAALCLSPSAGGSPTIHSQRPTVAVALALVPLLGVPGALLLGQGPMADLPLVPTPGQLQLGPVAQGGGASGTFVLHNHTSAAVVVAEVEKSCACTDLQLAMPYVLPGAAVVGTVRLDLANRPEFTGTLNIELRGKMASGQPAFLLSLTVSVEAERR